MADIVANPLDTAKAVQKSRIKAEFNKAPLSGCMLKAGYVMDCEREDIDNLSRLLTRLKETGTTTSTAQIRDKTNQFHTVTIADLSVIVGEMIDFGLALYQRKWDREKMIDACTTVQAVEAIAW